MDQSQRERIDDLIVSFTFGEAEEKNSAGEELKRLAQSSSEAQSYIIQYLSMNEVFDCYHSDLQEKYPRLTEKTVLPHHNLPNSAVLINRQKNWLLALSGLVLISSLVWWKNPLISSENISSPVGKQMEMTLDDGTSLQLNSNSSINFKNRLRTREVTLERGDALFSVKHITLKPFIVAASDVRIRDIGTRFTVSLRHEDIRVAVLEGIVNISTPLNSSGLNFYANNAAMVKNENIIPVNNIDEHEQFISWKDGILKFNGTLLSEVIEEIQHYRKAPVLLADKEAGKIRLTGVFSSTDPDLLLKTLPEVLPVQVKISNNGTAKIYSAPAR
ncbi:MULTISPECIES: FecR domain-containing protein [unclassified Brenneria]|uniref:FecR family protein n=1 Tax=unclassified Brenneria TaxID=2634434 RepID=UPI0029C3C03C|nr:MULTISPECIES: FecR domain-containing protein [unclassified Brenneria]MDX5627134.1 FecR domain-containing protein [Brenneria sp. L3-3Z]MDX5693516.1 FecR domain-containing protein [Brenneria sp. L4-2C]